MAICSGGNGIWIVVSWFYTIYIYIRAVVGSIICSSYIFAF